MWTSDDAYDRFMGRFSRRLAPLFADFAGVRHGERVLDVGAGTGALTGELVRRAAHVAAAEPAEQFADALHARFPELDVRQAPGEELPWPDDSFDVALAQLVVSFMNDAPAGVAEMRRVAGRVAICVWDYDGMELLHVVNLTRDALGDASTEPLLYRTPEELFELLGEATEVEPIDVEAGYDDFEDFWTALRGGVGPHGVWAAQLDDERAALARADLFRRLGEPDGPFTLAARAWAGRTTSA